MLEMRVVLLVAAAVVASAALAVRAAEKPAFPPPAPPEDTSHDGEHIQRTMTLLATSTPERRHRVRVLFYGQSITEQAWAKQVADDLRRRFPHADLDIRNLAIGGFASQLLCRVAEHDLYPFYPDLMIFYVFGDHRRYEDIIRETRRRTTAEIVMQTDHMTADADLTEEKDPAKLTPANWSAWMNHSFLPATAAKYGCMLLDQRTDWGRYLKDNGLAPKALLIDGAHLNDQGNALMAALVSRRLVYRPDLSADEWKDLVRTCEVGKDAAWQGRRLRLEFEGNRVDLLAAPASGKAAAVRVLIDGKAPSAFPGCYAITRPSGCVGIAGWPAVMRVTSEKPLVLEDWTARITKIDDAAEDFEFEVAGSKTGPDGKGSNKEKFVSASGRVVIEPEDWHIKRSRDFTKKPCPAGFEVTWKVVPMFVDTYDPARVEDPSREYPTTVAQGLPNGPHTLELVAEGEAPPAVRAIRTYRPPR